MKDIPDGFLWRLHEGLKARLVTFARCKLMTPAENRKFKAWPRGLGSVLDLGLTIGFARRFASYKRAALIFEDPKRLDRIVNDPERPVQFIFAGKAHPADAEGKAVLKRVAQFAASPRFRKRMVLIEDYEMDVARHMVAGVDVWLNNPRRPQEASGTSGMKPALHGGLNFSILDGWWPEAFDGKNGWAIGRGKDHDGTRAADLRDANELYRVLEKEIVPLYYDRDDHGLPRKWIARMKHAIATIPPVFNSHRQVKEYWKKYYEPALRAAARSRD
jgi:starch phosphorylase